MDFQLSDEQRMLKDTVDRLVRDAYDFEARKGALASTQGFSSAFWHQLATLGVLAMPFSESVGGLQGGAPELMVVGEAFGRGLVLAPYLATVVLAGSLIDALGNDAQKAKLLGEIADGSRRFAVALYEPEARYDHLDIASTARAAVGGYVLDGHKAVVLHGDSAEQLIVIARSSGDRRSRAGLTAFLVAADTDGVSQTGYRTIDGMHAADIGLAHVHVPAEARLGAEGGATDALEHALQLAIIYLCAEATGAMDVACSQTLEYIKQRRQFGVPIGSFQVLQHRMVDMRMELERVRSITMLAACSMDAPPDVRQKRISAAKAQVGKSGRMVAENAIQMFGGMGMMNETPISHYAKRIVMIDHWFGDMDYHLAQMARLIDVDCGNA